MARISLLFKAIRELGPRQLGLYAWYQLLLWSGYLRWKTGDRRRKTELLRPPSFVFRPILILPDSKIIKDIIGINGQLQLIQEADQIVAGQFRRFGGPPVPLTLTVPDELSHWTAYEQSQQPWGVEDVKFIWEPARFGWAFTLGRAYHLSSDERYSESFWSHLEEFLDTNPTHMGPNWVSAQEVAFRILAFAFAAQVFAASKHSTPSRIQRLATAIADHAERIPPSIVYARAQNNNHLLSEAAGLITAACVLPDHPKAKHWAKLGWRWFNQGVLDQISDDGTYSQHSTNYHRLVLQLALWISAIQRINESPNRRISKQAIRKIQLAVDWLLSLCDVSTGRVPNLGPNDGAYILPLSVLPFADYRPVLQAACKAFSGKPAFEPGSWDELGLWINSEQSTVTSFPGELTTDHRPLTTASSVIKNPRKDSWTYLRTAKFDGRPGHADQLHLDLWWGGLNIALDAGTYLYNAPQPWTNALVSSAVHNTVTVNGRDQMTPVTRFLYLDRVQAQVISRERAQDSSWERVIASHDGYQSMGVIHQRSVTMHIGDRWQVEDHLLPAEGEKSQIDVRLHWLLPDWNYDLAIEATEIKLNLESPFGWITLDITSLPANFDHLLVKAGEVLSGERQAAPTWGWTSPTYAHKIPALSLSAYVEAPPPIKIISEWKFPLR